MKNGESPHLVKLGLSSSDMVQGWDGIGLGLPQV